EQVADSAVDANGALGGAHQPGDELEQRRLAGTVAADDGDLLAARDPQIHRGERLVFGVIARAGRAHAEHSQEPVERLLIQTVDLARALQRHRGRPRDAGSSLTHGLRTSATTDGRTFRTRSPRSRTLR